MEQSADKPDPLSDAWQEYANSLVSIHHSLHSQSYQRVPDTGGDHGLEGFSTCGVAYQAYADQDSETPAERARKQKRKITTDLSKLTKYADFWEDTLQGVQLREWVLVVPRLDDKAVVRHARKKGAELAGKQLSFVSPTLQATVKTADDFPRAKRHLSGTSTITCLGSQADPTDAEVQEFSANAPDFDQNLRHKLHVASPSMVDDACHKMLVWHLGSQNLLASIREQYPVLWERIDKLIRAMASSIATDGYFDDSKPAHRLRNTKKRLEQKLTRDAAFLNEADREALAWGAIAEWLGECPLSWVEDDDG